MTTLELRRLGIGDLLAIEEIERKGETARRREADANAGEASRPDADGERAEVARVRASLSEQCVHVFEECARTRSTLGEHLAVVDERTRRHIRRSVESQHQHSSIETTLCASPACRKRTR